MTRILITGAGGPASIGVARSLKDHYLVGVDCNKYSLQFAETNERFLVPRADNLGYTSALNLIIEEHNIEFVHAQPDPEVLVISRNRDWLGAKTFLPSHQSVVTCQNKWDSYVVWRAAGITVPNTIAIDALENLLLAHSLFPKPYWIRKRHGAAGAGALLVDSYEQALHWIISHQGWGEFIASHYLPGRCFTWQSIWNDGVLVVAQGRERLAWTHGDRAPSGVTGVTGVARTYNSHELDEICQKSVVAIDPKPNGIWGVDLKCDENGIPNPTEINIGRFFTTIEFFTRLGLNMPEMYVNTAFGRRYWPVDPLEDGWYWLRSMDSAPRLVREP